MNKKESQIQSECVIWLWNNIPETRGLFFSVTNNSEHVVRALQRRGLGLVSGVSDCLFMWKGETYCFEFKTPNGKQSDKQKWWESRVTEHGFIYFIVRSFDEFRDIILGIIRNK